MRIFRGLDHYQRDNRQSIVALGTFDGVHLGHQKVLRTTVERARTLGLTALAVTFDPHPLEILQPDRAPTAILSLGEKLDLMAAASLDATLVIPFTHEFSLMGAEAFVSDILHETLKAREVVVGFNHTFGKDARGTSELLRRLAPALGFTVHVIPPLTVNGLVVSSSVIREALKGGNVRQCWSLLGRPFTVKGRVLRGEGRGQILGFPTANLKPERDLSLAHGVYAVRVEGEGIRAEGVTNVGYRPTFGGSEVWIETYLFDFSADLYGRTLRVAFIERIRSEQRFESVEALKAQIAQDIKTARQLLLQLS